MANNNRIQITLGDKAFSLLDRYADAMGVPRASLCAVLISQGLMNYNPAFLATGTPPGQPDKDRTLDEILAAAQAESDRT